MNETRETPLEPRADIKNGDMVPPPVTLALPENPTPHSLLNEAVNVIDRSLKHDLYHRYGPEFENLGLRFQPAPNVRFNDERDAAIALSELVPAFVDTKEDSSVPLKAAEKVIVNLPAEGDFKADAGTALGVAYVRAGDTKTAKAIAKGKYDVTKKKPDEKRAIYVRSSAIYQEIAHKAAEGGDPQAATIAEENSASLRTLPSELIAIAVTQRKHGHEELAAQTIDQARKQLEKLTDPDRMPSLTGMIPFYEQAAIAAAADAALSEEFFNEGMKKIEALWRHDPYEPGSEKPRTLPDWEMQPVVNYGTSAGVHGAIEAAKIAREIANTSYMGMGIPAEDKQWVDDFVRQIDLGMAQGYIKRGEFSDAEGIMYQVITQYKGPDRNIDDVRRVQIQLLYKQGRREESLRMAKTISNSVARAVVLEPIIEEIARSGDYATAVAFAETTETYNTDYLRVHALVLGGAIDKAEEAIRQIKMPNISSTIRVSQLLGEIAVAKHHSDHQVTDSRN